VRLRSLRRPGDFRELGETADAQPDHRERLGFEAMPARSKLALDLIEHLVGVLDATMKAAPIREPCRFRVIYGWDDGGWNAVLAGGLFPARVRSRDPMRTVGTREMNCLEEAIAINE
jgi:hypothetical protein